MSKSVFQIAGLIGIVLLICFLVFGCSSDDNPTDSVKVWSWGSMGTGLDYYVEGSAVYNDQVYVTGQFDSAGNTEVNHVAYWNGSSWRPLGSGVNSDAGVLCVYDDDLILGGWITTAGGNGANYIASWDGAS